MPDTISILIHEDDLNLPNSSDFDWTEANLKLAINFAVAQTSGEINPPTSFENFTVTTLHKENSYSKVAYLEGDLGYFIITQDMMMHLHVIFSRWD